MNEGIMVFKNQFDFVDKLSEHQFCEFMRMIRDTRWGGKDIDPDSIEDPTLSLLWMATKPSILKSKRNAKCYTKKQSTPKQASIETDTVKAFEEEGNVIAAVEVEEEPIESEFLSIEEEFKMSPEQIDRYEAQLRKRHTYTDREAYFNRCISRHNEMALKLSHSEGHEDTGATNPTHNATTPLKTPENTPHEEEDNVFHFNASIIRANNPKFQALVNESVTS